MKENAKIILDIIKGVKDSDSDKSPRGDQPNKDMLQFTWMNQGGQQLLSDIDNECLEEQGIKLYDSDEDDDDTIANGSRSINEHEKTDLLDYSKKNSKNSSDKDDF